MKSEARKYDAVVIGFGKGGKTLAGALATAGQKVAVIERSAAMYGGTCINVGCIPSKFLVHRAGLNHAEDADQELRFEEAMAGKRKLVETLRGKNYHKLADNPNITVIDGEASFVSEHEIEVNAGSESLTVYGDRIFVNTGSSPRALDIPGIEGNPYVYDSEGLLALTKRPKQLVIVGAGYLGLEFSSIFRNFGTEVTLLQNEAGILPREEPEIVQAVRRSLEARGIALLLEARLMGFKVQEGQTEVHYTQDGQDKTLLADAVLIATGRVPNTAALHVERAGLKLNKRGGIETDEQLRSSVPHIFAMGDVRGAEQFTYLSLDDYRIVRSAVLGDGSYTLKQRGAVPYSMFTEPSLARVGMSEAEAKAAGYEVKTAQLPAAAIPKAHVLEQPTGHLKAVVDAGSGRILGAHLFCESAHEMINIVKLAMDAGLPYTALRDGIFTHPTMSEALNDLFGAIG